MSISSISARSLAIVALGATLVATASAQATYLKRSLPDHDQRRNTLPNGGGVFCVPTSYSDLFRYMANHGIPDMDSAYGLGYADTTNFINNLATVMGTDPALGSWPDPSYNGAKAWVTAHRGFHLFHHTRFGPNTFWGPSAMRNLMNTGAHVEIFYGRYRQSGGYWGRTGGHAVALAGFDWRFAQKQLFVADPWTDDGNTTTQGAFTIDTHNTQTTVMPISAGVTRILPQYDNDYVSGGYNYRAAVDYMHGIQPIWYIWLNPRLIKPTFYFEIPWSLEDSMNPLLPREIVFEVPDKVIDWSIDHGDTALVTLSPEGLLSQVDIITKTSNRLASIPGATKVVVAGAGRDVYVLAGDKVVRIDRSTGKQYSLGIPKGASSLEPDPKTRGLLALYPNDGAIVAIDENVRGYQARRVAFPEGTGALFFAPEKDGTITIGRAKSKELVRMFGDGSVRRLPLAAPMDLRGLQAADGGVLLAQDGEKLVTLDANGRLSKSQFDGQSAGGAVRFSQSWDALKPEDISGKEWQNVPPDGRHP